MRSPWLIAFGWNLLPAIVRGFVLAPPQCTPQLCATNDRADLSTSDEAWDSDVIGKLRVWADDMKDTFGSVKSVPTAHIHRTTHRFSAAMTFDIDGDDTSISADSIDIRLVTVGQQPFLTVSGPQHHQAVALDGTLDLDTLEAILLPGNVLRIEADKHAPQSAGLRIPVVDKRG